MTKLDSKEDATADEEPKEPATRAVDQIKGRRSLSRMRPELTDEELASSGVAKILNDDVERLERDVANFRNFEKLFHEKDLEVAVLKEKQRKSTAVEVTSSSALAIGALLAGMAPTGWDNQPAGAALLFGGIVVLIMGIVSKVVAR